MKQASTDHVLPSNPQRRALLARTAMLSTTAMALLSGVPLRSLAATPRDEKAASDVGILNVALSLEHEGIAAYEIGAETGLLSKQLLAVAALFKSHHEGHREVLTGAIESMGGKPLQPKSISEYKASSKLAIESIATGEDVLRLAQRLELGAINAYLGVMPSFVDRSLSKVAGRLIADETLHYTVLSQALGQPLPQGTLSFGA
ncbi:MAG: ferritin-like domain-containing protein [Sinimarinibacterium flocculans]|uniref:ferritin-like domain-containing protein n=1 Tax=Sinimarinibacterium flocculans TaxID=985250 RepID=UPI002EC564F2|nr:ferritin-like domain-containing protein [Pseudomonadota bacterium]